MKNILELRTDRVVTKGDRKFTRLVGGFGEDKPAISDKQIAELLGYSKGERQVRVQINNNIKHFKEEHIIDLQRVLLMDTLDDTLKSLGYAKQSITQAKNIYILSQAGFLLYLKFAEGDKAVELYKDFIEDYFKIKVENQELKETIQEEIEFLKEQKAMLLGRSFMEEDTTKKSDLYTETEKINIRITELEKSLSIEETKKEVVERLKPKLEVAETIERARSNFDMKKFAKVLGIKGVGRNKLFEWLRSKNILMSDNEPYQKYSEYFGVLPVVSSRGHINNKTVVKPKGVEFILKRLVKDRVVVTKTPEQIIRELELLD